jgi:hypothetical protein
MLAPFGQPDPDAISRARLQDIQTGVKAKQCSLVALQKTTDLITQKHPSKHECTERRAVL